MNNDKIADQIMSHLELVLGPRVFSIFIEEITTKYLEGLDARAAIIEKPELFEHAVSSTIGVAGSVILGEICHKICKDNNNLENLGSKPINLAGFIEIMTKPGLRKVNSLD